MSTTIAHFTVTGEFITQQARSFWNDEDAPERALNLLKCMRGITDAQCIAILEGRKKLIGDSSTGIVLAGDNAPGRSLAQTLIKLKSERDEARDERADLTEMLSGNTVQVASPTGLRRVPRRKTKRDSHGFSTLNNCEFDDHTTRDSAKPLKIWQQMESPAPAAAAPIEPREPPKPLPEPPIPYATETITNDTGWLSPEGKFYPCGYAGHARVAWALGLTDNPANHGITLSGWVRLGVTADQQHFFTEDPAQLKDVQNELIRAYCAKKSIELPYWLREEDNGQDS